MEFAVRPIGWVRSPLRILNACPRQGKEGAPAVWIEIDAAYAEALDGLLPGHELWVLTWLDRADRSRLRVHPRGDRSQPLTGVFRTRSPHRPNPIGLHRVRLLEVDPVKGLRVEPLEVLDGTPVLDIKCLLDGEGWAEPTE